MTAPFSYLDQIDTGPGIDCADSIHYVLEPCFLCHSAAQLKRRIRIFAAAAAGKLEREGPLRMNDLKTDKWPKKLPELSEEQKRIKEDFMEYWHEVLPKRYKLFESFNQNYPLAWRPALSRKIRTLEVGCGLGEHIDYEDLSDQEYHAIDIRPVMVERTTKRFPSCIVKHVDCEQGLPYVDGYFDRVISIHVLEHLPNLPDALKHIHRALDPDGRFLVVIPCDPGLLYGLAREISTKRLVRKRYNTSFDWLIGTEHINSPSEIREALDAWFVVEHSTYFPTIIPVVHLNLAIGLTLKPHL